MAAKKNVFSIPTPFEMAILLTALVLVLATLLTDHSLSENLVSWGEGLWSLLAFMTQMALVLLLGYVLAVSLPVQKVLETVARLPQREWQVMGLTFFISVVGAWLNWGLGLVAAAFLARKMAQQHSGVHYPLLVAVSYMGFIFWHGGLSGSIPLLVSSPGHFSAKWMNGETVALSQTLFSSFNLSLILVLFLVMCAWVLTLHKLVRKKESFDAHFFTEDNKPSLSLSETYRYSGLYWLLVLTLASYLVLALKQGRFQLDLNGMIFLFFLFSLVAHGGFSSFVRSVRQGCDKLGPILIQYPLYAGIMGVMLESGLAAQISQGFVSLSRAETYPVWMFVSAGLVNIFVPSGGGQWAVQAPIVLSGASELGVPTWKVVLAVAWGDAWTNLAQPFWAIPLLSVVGLSLKHIALYCLSTLFVSGFVIAGFFYFF